MLLSKRNEFCFPNCVDNTVLSNDIAEFFVRKTTTIRNDIDVMVLDPASPNLVPDDQELPADDSVVLSAFRKLNEEEVRALIMASVKKYCALDHMPTPLLIDCLDARLPVITHLINSFLVNGYFPQDWKEAFVKPILKKEGLQALFSNLHPISNSQFVSTLTERAVYE